MKACEKAAILDNIKQMSAEYQNAVKNNNEEKKLFFGGYVVALADLCQQLGIKIK